MFDLDSFDLDIDDDFSSSIFSSGVSRGAENILERENSFKESSSNRESNQSLAKRVREKPINSESPSSNSFFSFQFPKDSKETCFKRPGVQNEEPQKKRLSHESLLERKFPGPAGLLPDKPFKEICDVSLPMEKPRGETNEIDEGDSEKSIVYSQSSGSIFLESNYQRLLSDFNLNEPKNPLNRYTVEWLKKTALSKGFQGKKIPFLGLVVHSVNHTMPDPVIVLRDPTGEIRGSLHREVWADLGGKLKAGIALALRQVGVLITGVIRRQIYLNITMNNILALYCPSVMESQVEITRVNEVSNSELLKSFEQWLPQPSRTSGARRPTNPGLFSTVDSPNLNPPPRKAEERSTDQVLADLGVYLSDTDFGEEMEEGGQGGGREACAGAGEAPTRALSQAESLIFEEVLKGVDLDEFET